MICPKCGQRAAGPFFRREYGGERLEYICQCGYKWRVPTHDARRPAKPYTHTYTHGDEHPYWNAPERPKYRLAVLFSNRVQIRG